MKQFKTGQQIYYVPSGNSRGEPYFTEIITIGRKWISLKNGHRFDPELMAADGKGYCSPGKIYLTKEKYEDEQELRTTWNKIEREFRYRTPSVSVEAMRKIAKLLGVK